MADKPNYCKRYSDGRGRQSRAAGSNSGTAAVSHSPGTGFRKDPSSTRAILVRMKKLGAYNGPIPERHGSKK